MFIELSPATIQPKLADCAQQINDHLRRRWEHGQPASIDHLTDAGITIDFGHAFLTMTLTDGSSVTAIAALDAHDKPAGPPLRVIDGDKP